MHALRVVDVFVVLTVPILEMFGGGGGLLNRNPDRHPSRASMIDDSRTWLMHSSPEAQGTRRWCPQVCDIAQCRCCPCYRLKQTGNSPCHAITHVTGRSDDE